MRTGFAQRLGFFAYQLAAWALIALCVMMIHDFSLQDAARSDALSLEVTDVAYRVLQQPEGKIKRNSESYERLHGYVRKGAHALEYSLLAVAVMMVLAPFRMRVWKRILVTLLLCAAFAGYDEWTQMASEGRSPALRDVGIDTLGAFAGCLATLMVRQMALLELRHEAFFRERRQGRLRRDSE